MRDGSAVDVQEMATKAAAHSSSNSKCERDMIDPISPLYSYFYSTDSASHNAPNETSDSHAVYSNNQSRAKEETTQRYRSSDGVVDVVGRRRKTSECRENPKTRNTETPKTRNTENPKHRNTETPKHQNTETSKHRNTETPK